MKKWNELTITEKIPYIKAGLDNGIYDISLIENIFNSFEDGGYIDKIKNKISSIYNSWFNKPEEKPAESKRFSRILPNDSEATKIESEKLENEVIRKQQGLKKKALENNRDSEPYYIPYIYKKEIKIPNVGRLSSNILDSLVVNMERYKAGKNNIPANKIKLTKRDLYKALGLAGQETVFGGSPNFSMDAENKRYKAKHGKNMPKDLYHKIDRASQNMSVARNFGGIYPEFLVNDHDYSNRGWDNSKYKDKLDIDNPLIHAYTLFDLGLYNPGDVSHTSDVMKKGEEIYNTKVFQDWYKNYLKQKK